MDYKPYKISEIVDEAKGVKTFLTDKDVKAKPGQFVGVWIPGVSVRPFSLSSMKPMEITVKLQESPSSIFTPALFGLKEGDRIFVSEPRGNGFPEAKHFKCKKDYNVAGGSGIAVIPSLAEYIRENTFGSTIVSFIGAKSSDDLFFEKRLRKVGEVYVATEDGSRGERGLVTKLLEKYEFDVNSKAAVCGPEKMMSAAARLLAERQVGEKDIYVCLERIMRCDSGLCGSCVVGGLRACVDGSIFTYSQLKGTDFGSSKRDRCGRKEYF